MRVLVIGGTRFVGLHFARAALAAGHEVTVFHRGRSGAGQLPGAEHRTGDRDGDLAALRDGRWDATADFCAYLPRQVSALAAALDGRGGRHLLISSVSAYRSPAPAGFTEDQPLAEPAGPEVTDVSDVTYGALKAACEHAALAAYGSAALTIVRPTYVIGPHDYSYRFTWWTERIARGGTVLAPGDPADPMQVIDARDLGAWMTGLLERAVPGAFHAASPAPPFGFGDMLEAIAAQVAPPGTRLAWASTPFLTDAGVSGPELPLWSGTDAEDASLNQADPAAALAAGLDPRPLRASAADVHAAEAVAPTPVPPGTGLDPARESALLARMSPIAR
jgi:2'-hydroxyisoflavone reductase